MDSNKDESERCANMARQFLSKKLFQKAFRFAQKAHQLFPTDETKHLLDNTKLLADRQQQEEEEQNKNDESEPGKSNTETPSTNNNNNNNNNSSQNDTRTVEHIRSCRDYYEILGVTKTATEIEIKRQYRKLALQFHPDKNKTPGAAEAFKAIGNSFAVLSDPEKRRRYDLEEQRTEQYGTTYRNRRRSDGFGYREFDEDYNAEEIFNMFFGPGFTAQNVYVYRNGQAYYPRARHGGGGGHNAESQANAGYTVLLQIMPILFFICISLLSNFVPDNPYSLSHSHKYPYQRYTENLKVPYYVKENFERDYKDTLHQIESHVEESYISNLQSSCFKERNYKENLIHRAKFLRDTTLESKAKSLKTPSCDRLIQIQNAYR